MEETISLQEIFGILKKRTKLITLMTILGLLISGIITFFVITPKYASEAQLIVTLPQGENNQASVNDVNANLMMLNTYKDLIKGNAVLNAVQKEAKEKANFKGNVGDLNNAITVNQSQNSQMFSIKATTDNAYMSESIANITAEVFQEKVKEILTVDKISVISEAKVNTNPVSPNKKLNLAIGLVLGLMIGVGISFLLEFLDKTVKDVRYLTEDLGLTMLGTITYMPDKDLKVKIADTAKTLQKGRNGEKATNATTTAPRRSRNRV